MKNIVKILSVATAVFALASCETYKVAEPDMTAVCKADGQYVCFAYASETSTEPVALLYTVITNTTSNESNRVWITVVDYDRSCNYFTSIGKASKNGLVYPSAARFPASYDASTNSFSATNIAAEWPATAYSPYQEQYYYTLERQYNPCNYTVSCSGKVVVDGVNTKTGYKTDGIYFTYTRNNGDGTTDTYYVSGMKNTGWGEDTADYAEYIDNYLY